MTGAPRPAYGRATAALQIHLLTPVEASLEGRPVPLGGTKQRALLAMLALEANRTVSVERLIEGLWGEDAPPTAVKMLQGYVSQLRKLLPEAILTRGRGYELRIEPGAVDVECFAQLIARAAGDGAADGHAREALALWRGNPLGDVAGEPFAAAEVRRLQELWLVAQELAIDAELAAGRHLELVPRLAALACEHPLRERLHAQRMLALYRAGRQAEALEAFHDARRALGELGLEPGAELRRLQAAILRHDPALRPSERLAVVCPFKGLAPFEADDARFFFGRERLIAEMVTRLADRRLLAVVGPSGCGKSSAVRAGLLPALAGGALPASEAWPQVLIRPGPRPLAELEMLPARGPVVLAIDQFEETYTACRDADEQRKFLDAVVTLAEHRRRRALVVLALRADFYGRCAAHPGLARLVASNQVLVGPLQPEELRRAIEGPAGRAGLEVEPALSDALVGGLDGAPGALPLLSTALLELWRERDGERLTLAAYERVGGVRGAVARLAESAFASLSPAQQAIARRLLLRLAGEDERGILVRRRVALEELDAGDPEVATVLDLLAGRRLIAVDAGGAEVAHEALLHEWPRLSGWLDEDAHGRRLHRHLAGAAREWAARGRDPGDLYRGARLASALEWCAGHGHDLNALEREFLAAARERSEREAVEARRINRRLRGLLSGAAVLLALAIVAGVVALNQRGQARDSAVVAEAERLGATALLEKRLDRSLLLAKAGNDLADSSETRANLLGALLRSPAALRIIHGTGDRILDDAISPDGRTLVLGDNRGVVLFLDPRTDRVTGRFQAPGPAFRLRFSADGRTLAVATAVLATRAGIVQLVDPATHRLRATLRGVRPGTAFAVAVTRDGARVAAVDVTQFGTLVPASGTVLVWDVGRGDRPVARAPHLLPTPPADGIDFTPDGRRLVVGSQRSGAALVDARTLRVLERVPARGDRVQRLSPDGRTLAVGGSDGTVELVDLHGGDVRPAGGRHDSAVVVLAFSPDGRTLVTGGADAKVIVWDIVSAGEREVWAGHSGNVMGAAVSSDGRTAYTAGLDSTAIAWDLTGDRRLGRPFRTGTGNDPVASGLVSPDGRTLAVAHGPHSISLIDTTTLRERLRVRLPRHVHARYPAYSPDGRLLGVSGDGPHRGYIGLFDAATGRPRGEIPQRQWSNTPGLGRRLIVTGSSDIVQTWDRRTLRPVGPALDVSNDGLDDVSISPDDRYVALGLLDGKVEVRAARTMRRIALLQRGRSSVPWTRFSPDARLLVAGDDDGVTRVWSTATWRLATPPLSGQAGGILSASVAPGDRLLATSNTDGTVALWDLTTGRELGTPLPGEPNRRVAASFTPDGRWLFASYSTGRAYRWDMRPASWRAKACAVAGRDLTRGEWTQLEPTRPYASVCPHTR